MSSVLVTGCAGFIGMHVCLKLFEQGQRVVGVDSLNDYYPKPLKLARLDHLRSAHPSFAFHRADIADLGNLTELIKAEKVTKVVHLAAQAGVRYSIENPMAYQHSNLLGMTCVLEACRRNEIQHLTYASTSSVYGDNPKVPFVESDSTDQPVSFYAATKKANEVMASSYSHLYGLPATGLRFFTVYGPWGRPDMAYWMFSRAILLGKPIKVFGNGILSRDFTFVDDIVTSLVKLLDMAPLGERPHRILNVGNSAPVSVNDLIGVLEQHLDAKTVRENYPIPLGDVVTTFADSSALTRLTGYAPTTNLSEGLEKFVSWYKQNAEKFAF